MEDRLPFWPSQDTVPRPNRTVSTCLFARLCPIQPSRLFAGT